MTSLMANLQHYAVGHGARFAVALITCWLLLVWCLDVQGRIQSGANIKQMS